MAMTAFAPAITRSKEIFAQKSAQAVLRLVPDVSSGKQANRKFFAKFVTVVGTLGLMFLLLINTLLAQDALEITSEIDKISSPDALAKAAVELGMRPSENPTFLSLDKPITEVPVKNG